MKKNRQAYGMLNRLHYILLIAISALLYIFHPSKMSISAAIIVILYIAGYEIYQYVIYRNAKKTSQDVVQMLNIASQKRLIDFPLPVIICDRKGDVLWYNDRFAACIDKESLQNLKNVNKFSQSVLARQVTRIKFTNKYFNVYKDSCDISGNLMNILYFIDMSDLKQLEIKYNHEKSVIAHILVDNYDELFQKAKESEKSTAMAQIDSVLSNWSSSVGGIMRKTEKDSYFFIFKNEDLSQFIDKRFNILDNIKALDISPTMQPTISIGIGLDSDTLAKNEESALVALEMALSRGGDQAVIKTKNGFEFFGGASRGVEKHTKVKARVVASSFLKLMSDVETILVMGHQCSDFDSIGACIGIARIALEKKKKIGIVFDKNYNTAMPVYNMFKANNSEMIKYFVDPETALSMDGPKTLVVVVDTHRAGYTTMPSLLKYAGYIAVIDHHRKAADFIDNANIFFHEPYASSVCEMVTEIMQYMNINKFPICEAEALLAGIYLDTKDFMIKTSIHTFEAASFLRKSGANTISVKRLFQTDMQTYKQRVKFITTSEIYKKHSAIAVWPDTEDASQFRLISSQAADEMLRIEGVKASFTLFKDKSGIINISARSLGEVNVQIILEKLDGGGHQNMAGAQLKTSIEKATQKLKDAIDIYYRENLPEN